MKRSIGILLVVLAVGMRWSMAEEPKAVPPSTPDGEPFHKELKAAAKDYLNWHRVDDEMHWAPTLCRTPMPGVAAFSASKDEETHGQKLYSLFAKKREEYAQFDLPKTSAIGQTIVKQSWIPEEITDEKEKPKIQRGWVDFHKVIRTRLPPFSDKVPYMEWMGDHFFPYAVKGDKIFKASKQADLFIMLKFDPKTPDTDLGWVYGTVTPDGKKVTSAGRVESCMKCHKEATADRLFGMYYATKSKK